MKLGFATDIHLDAIRKFDQKGYPDQRAVGERLAGDHDALVITGDISTGEKFKDHFGAFCEGAQIPVYFVLGNHDFWDAPESDVRAMAATFPGCLDRGEVVELNPRVALVGRSGWYDTLSGHPTESRIEVNDWVRASRLIGPYSSRVPHLLHKACQRWSEEEAAKAVPVLEEAAKGYQEVFFGTHFPCFRSACFAPDGTLDSGERGWWPWSINTTMGHAIREVTDRYPNTDFTVLTGHTHGGGKAQITPNLRCIAGRAQHGYPRLAESWIL